MKRGEVNGTWLESHFRWQIRTFWFGALWVGLCLAVVILTFGIGIIIGHLLTVDSLGPALGGGAALFALLGGMWFPFTNGSGLQKVGEYVPSYWIAQAARVGVGAGAWPAKGWLVIAGWTVVLGIVAARAYQRDTKRV